jgi:hypothetical protein
MFIVETSGRVKCLAGKQFPAPGTTLQVPMPGPRAKQCKCRGGGNATIDWCINACEILKSLPSPRLFRFSIDYCFVSAWLLQSQCIFIFMLPCIMSNWCYEWVGLNVNILRLPCCNLTIVHNIIISVFWGGWVGTNNNIESTLCVATWIWMWPLGV